MDDRCDHIPQIFCELAWKDHVDSTNPQEDRIRLQDSDESFQSLTPQEWTTYFFLRLPEYKDYKYRLLIS